MTKKAPKATPKFIAKKISTKRLNLTSDYLSSAISEVIGKLTKAGYEAYIVGGGVRDELLGMHPKDFDAVTNATPNEIKKVFGKRCRIIGRRFQLAHVYSGRDMIEVATFRAPPTQKTNQKVASVNASGMVVRDNVWGTIEQDFSRRDFTINALYYQPEKKFVYDFCGAIDDIHNRSLRFLGDTQTRIDEDPVRMLRALRFAAKLDLTIAPEIINAFTTENWQHLLQVSPHRLYDETLKMFGGGYANKLLPLMFEHNAIHFLVAEKITSISDFLQKVAENTDARINMGKSINPAFFYAALLWPAYQKQVDAIQKHLPLVEAIHKAGIKIVNAQRKITAIPRFAESFMRDTWALQPKLINPKPSQIPAIAELARFRAAFDFLYLREQSGDTSTLGMGQWWHDYQLLETNDAREVAIKTLNRKQLRQKRKPVTLDETPIVAPRKESITLPKSKAKLAPRKRKRRQPSQILTSANPANQTKHLLADTVRGDKPQTHD